MSFKLGRTLKSKFGISAPRLSVRTHIPWPLRMIAIGVLVAMGLLLGQWVFETGLQWAGFAKTEAEQRMAQLNARVAALTQQNDSLRGENLRLNQQIEIEQTTHKDLAKSLQGLQEESATLREDNAFFRNLLSPDASPGIVSIYHFKVERNPVLSGEYRYRLLLLKSGKREQEFSGRVQILVTGEQSGNKVSLTQPPPDADNPQGMVVKFKYYQRLEGVFEFPPGLQPRTAQVRVFEDGSAQAKWTKTVNF